ncbi:sensor histidine kinase [Rhodococcus qingshengii]|uniref:sensor histidine kinase n=1 Tax=Rhodococcus qingshengii TaxID=334542 RepID=UPI0037C66A42
MAGYSDRRGRESELIDRAVSWGRGWISDAPAVAVPGPMGTVSDTVKALIGRHPTRADAVLAAVMGVWALPQMIYHARHSEALFFCYLLLSVLLVVPLIWRRRFPLSTFAFAASVALVQWAVGIELSADITLLVYLYTVASRYRLRVAVLAAGVIEFGAVLASVRWPRGMYWTEMLILLTGPVVAALMLGVYVRDRRNSVSLLLERAKQLERDRDHQAVIAAVEERTRIAREMHDVVAHSLLVMVTLSEGAALKQAREPERAGEAMRQVSATGRQALAEIRRLLGVLRTETAPHERSPQPGVAEIDGLLERIRQTGLDVDVRVTGAPDGLPPGAELVVFRIVQEALTNTLKHSVDPSHVGIVIVYGAEAVTVDIHDDGARTTGATAEGAGQGLSGMRERAAVYGGTVDAGPDSAGGWRIRAHLPFAARTADAR